MSESNLIHDNFHTKQRVHSARCTHAHITQLYIMSIQPVNKAAEHLINSTLVLERKKEREKKSSQCLSYKERERETDRQTDRQTETDS